MEIKLFENEQFGMIRTVMQDEEPWFVAKDVAAALGYANPRDALATHVDEEDKRILQRSEITTLENHIPKDVFPVNFVDANIPNRGLTIINESGLYALIFGSKLESAKRFKHWVTSVILPSIRKTGGYNDKMAIAKLLASCKLKGAVTAICDLYGIGYRPSKPVPGGSDDDRVIAEFVRANTDNICGRQACEVYGDYCRFCTERGCKAVTQNMFGRRMHSQHGILRKTQKVCGKGVSIYYQLEVE